MSRWFRHYSGMARDEKLVAVAIRSKQSVERVIWIWAAILESASEIDDGGRFELDPAEAAYFLRADEADISAVLAGLAGAGRVADDRVVKWGDRQYQSDSAAERQARYRERKKQSRAGRDGEPSRGDVTPPSPDRNVTAQETDTDTDSSDADASAAVAAPIDYRHELWNEGLASLARQTGKLDGQLRGIIGRWLRDTSDDCRTVLAKIRQAEADRIGDPVPWITRAIAPRSPPQQRAPHTRDGVKDLLRRTGNVQREEGGRVIEGEIRRARYDA